MNVREALLSCEPVIKQDILSMIAPIEAIDRVGLWFEVSCFLRDAGVQHVFVEEEVEIDVEQELSQSEIVSKIITLLGYLYE